MQRRIDLEGCLNFRDLGGYVTDDGRRVRWRRVFRSDALHTLSATDVARLRCELGIEDVIDLRSTVERQVDGYGLLALEPFRFHHLPLYDGDTRRRDTGGELYSLGERYVLLADIAREPIARILTLLATGTAGTVYHCAAGKDRTGIVTAVILGVLGVREELIVADYAATQENLDEIVKRLLAAEGYRTMLEALPPDTLHAQPETMAEFLAGLRERYGSVREYARAAGVGDDVLDRLHARLLET